MSEENRNGKVAINCLAIGFGCFAGCIITSTLLFPTAMVAGASNILVGIAYFIGSHFLWPLGAVLIAIGLRKKGVRTLYIIPALLSSVVILALTPFGADYLAWRFRPRARLGPCASNLKQLSKALAVYATNNDGAFPDTLESFANLYPKYVPKPETFWCPSDHNNKTAPTTINSWALDGANSSQMSYIYSPGRSLYEDNGTIMLKDNSPLNHEGKGVWAIHADWHLGWISVKEKLPEGEKKP